MTAHRPRATGPLQNSTWIDVFFSSETAVRGDWRVGQTARQWRPPTDMYETDDQIVVQVEVAGVRPEDIRVTLNDRVLTISGVRVDTRGERRAYYQMEVHFGEFRTDIDLPGPVEAHKVDAEYSQGFLRVTLPKARPERVRLE